jgi:peptide deformylase
MSFPGLCVRVRRYKRCVISFLDKNFLPCEMHFCGDLSELLQHEYDHLDGILATMRAVDNKSFYMMQMKRNF